MQGRESSIQRCLRHCCSVSPCCPEGAGTSRACSPPAVSLSAFELMALCRLEAIEILFFHGFPCEKCWGRHMVASAPRLSPMEKVLTLVWKLSSVVQMAAGKAPCSFFSLSLPGFTLSSFKKIISRLFYNIFGFWRLIFVLNYHCFYLRMFYNVTEIMCID